MKLGPLAIAAMSLLALTPGATATAASGGLRVAPPTVHFGTKRVGTFNLKHAVITNAGSSTINLFVEGTRLPDDFSFGLLPGSDCPPFTPSPLAPGESCKAVVGFRPSDFFAGQQQHAQLQATATDPSTGAVLETVLIDYFGTGQ